MEFGHGETEREALSPGRLELAHVLFMDLVAYSKMPMEDQKTYLNELQVVVRSTTPFQRAERENTMLSLSTGDGMALVFFGDLDAPAQCALEIAAALKAMPHISLRMGINTGPVYRVADINASANINGGGINLAQRVMDAGDAGHILVSKNTAEPLLQSKQWLSNLRDLGQHSVKHGVVVHLFNLCTEELGNSAVPSRIREQQERAKKARKRHWILVFTILCLGGATLAILVFTMRSRSSPQIQRRRAVAVLGFRNLARVPGTDWVSTTLTEGLRTELGGSGQLRTVSGEEVSRMNNELSLLAFDSLNRETLAKLKRRGADLVIIGSFIDSGRDSGGTIHLNAQVQDAAIGETIDSLAADGTESELGKLISQAGERLRTKLGVGQVSAQREREVAMSLPSNEAAPYYSDGIVKLRLHDAIASRNSLERAVMIDPSFPFAHSALAEALNLLGYDDRAKEEARKAFDAAQVLSLEDRLSIEGRYRFMSAEWDKSIDAYQQLFRYRPDDIDYGVMLVGAERSAGRAKDALETIAALRRLPAPEGNDPRIDLEEAETAESIGNFARAELAAANAQKKSQLRGSKILESRALTWRCAALKDLGKPEQARSFCEQAITMDSGLLDRLGRVRAENSLAVILYDQGDLPEARRKFEEALRLAGEIGSTRDISGALQNLGMVLAAEGNLAEAETRYQAALSIQREIGFKPDIPKTLNNLADLLNQQGKLVDSKKMFERSIAAAKEIGSDDTLALALANLGAVLLELGDLPGARENLIEALNIQRRVGDRDNVASTLDTLAEYSLKRADFIQAQKLYEEAWKIQQGLSEKGAATGSSLGLAAILQETGHSKEAEQKVRELVEEFGPNKDLSLELSAHLLLAETLLSQRKGSDAAMQVSIAEALSVQIPQPSARYSVAILKARAQIARGLDLAIAAKSLRLIVQETRQALTPGQELEALLGLADVEFALGHSKLGRVMQENVRREAMRLGFLLIARKAGHQR